jgi:2-polyprenyl-6-methoxyphenol hydroxylase-like FAD-dependent oxidoreductase
VLFFPQARTEELLAEHVSALGVPILRSHAVCAVVQHDEGGVTVEADTPAGARVFRPRYVVGCEGGSSPVRESAGIELVGNAATLQFVMGDVLVREPPDEATVSLNGDAGAFFMVRLGDGLVRVAPLDLASMSTVRDEPPTLEELRVSVQRVAGTDYGMYAARWLTRWGNATLLASRYRDRCVLLAGDSAHLFPPLGGQGLNLGLQDATNLAWKLAATIHGWAPDGLLDTYHDERHPVGQIVVEDTLAQMALVSAATREGRALRRRFDVMLGTHSSLNRELAARLAGLATAYRADGACEHPLTGRPVPDLELDGCSAPSVFGLLRAARFVLLDLSGGRLGLPDAGRRADRLVVAAARPADTPTPEWDTVQAVLIRPDGHVAWACDDARSARAEAPSALARWLDAGRTPTTSASGSRSSVSVSA